MANQFNAFTVALEKQGLADINTPTFAWICKEFAHAINYHTGADTSASEVIVAAEKQATKYWYKDKQGNLAIDPHGEGKSHKPDDIQLDKATETCFYMHPNVPMIFTEWDPERAREQVIADMFVQAANAKGHAKTLEQCAKYQDAATIQALAKVEQDALAYIRDNKLHEKVDVLTHERIISSSKIVYPLAIPLDRENLKKTAFLLLPQDNETIANNASNFKQYRPNIGITLERVDEAVLLLERIRAGEIQNPYKDRQTAERVLAPFFEIQNTFRSKQLDYHAVLNEILNN